MYSNNKNAIKSHQKYGDIIVIKYYSKKYSDSTSLQIQSQYLLGELKLYMEVVALDYFKNDNIVKEVSP